MTYAISFPRPADEFFISRLVPVSGILAAAVGAAAIVPAIGPWLARGTLDPMGCAVVAVGVVLIAGGAVALAAGFRGLRTSSIPAPVRAAILASGLFLAFCGLEFSDGLLHRGGRIFYWTSVLFPPALALFYGLDLAKRWAWWGTRIATAIAILWFLVILTMLPYVGLFTAGREPVPWQGRLYAASITLAFAAVSAYAFLALGRAEARKYFGME